MKKALFLLVLTSLLFSCKKDPINESKLSNEPKVLNPKIKELLSLPLVDSVAETGGKITGYFKDGRKITYVDSTKSALVDLEKQLSNTSVVSTSSGENVFLSFFDVQLATSNPASINFTAMLNCQLVNGYAMVTGVTAMNMTILNGSTTIYHPGSSGATTTYYTIITSPSYYHSPLYMPTVTLSWVGTKQTRTTIKASANSTPASSMSYSPINENRTYSANIPTPPPN